jgi:hypothetical protein
MRIKEILVNVASVLWIIFCLAVMIATAWEYAQDKETIRELRKIHKAEMEAVK